MNESNTPESFTVTTSNTSNEPVVTTPSLEGHATHQQVLLDTYINRLKAEIAQKEQIARNKYYAKKKNKAKMKKASQKACREHDKKFLKRKAKRDAKKAKNNPQVSNLAPLSPENDDAVRLLSLLRY